MLRTFATKPFGSRVELLLDGATLSSPNSASYVLPTGSGATKTLVINMVGSRQGNNAIVI